MNRGYKDGLKEVEKGKEVMKEEEGRKGNLDLHT